jgi:hypothetical protein
MVAADRSQRDAAHSRPPFWLIQSTCCTARKIVASAGVLYVCSLREFSMAVCRLRNSGM